MVADVIWLSNRKMNRKPLLCDSQRILKFSSFLTRMLQFAKEERHGGPWKFWKLRNCLMHFNLILSYCVVCVTVMRPQKHENMMHWEYFRTSFCIWLACSLRFDTNAFSCKSNKNGCRGKLDTLFKSFNSTVVVTFTSDLVIRFPKPLYVL